MISTLQHLVLGLDDTFREWHFRDSWEITSESVGDKPKSQSGRGHFKALFLFG